MSSNAFTADYVPCPDPFIEFDVWFKKALASSEIEPTSMALATVDRRQKPRNRIVLYKGMIDDSLMFVTNYESNKAQELEVVPFAAVSFHWKSLELQVRVEGRVSKISRAESEKYFATRDRESQIGAWVSSQSRVLGSRKDLEAKKQEVEKKFAGKDVTCPSYWGGYKITPDVFEFWISGPGRLHNRFQYLLDKKQGWILARLWP